MPEDFSELRRIIRGKGPLNAGQARKLARVAVRAIAPKAIELEEDLAQALEAIPVAELLRGESDAARKSALEAVDDVERIEQAKKNSSE